MNPIEKLKALEAAATPGPWEPSQYGSVIHPGGDPIKPIVLTGFALSGERSGGPNRDLLTALRNLAPEVSPICKARDAFKAKAAEVLG